MVKTPNAMIPLASRNQGGLFEAIEAGKQSKRNKTLFDLALSDRERSIQMQDKDRAAAQQAAQRKAQEESQRKNLESVAAGAVQVKPLLDNIETIPQATRVLERRIQEIEGRNGDASDTKEVLEMIRSGRIDQARAGVNSAIEVAERFGVLKPSAASSSAVPAGTQEFNALTEAANSSDPLVSRAAKVKLGLEERAGSLSARERIALDDFVSERVTKTESDRAEQVEFAKKTGASRASAIDDAFEKVAAVRGNISNLNNAVQALEDGAQTGPIINKYTPTVREATIRLEQIQAELGLDVVGATTFGALSEGELALAKEVALPANLPPDQLKTWIQNKIIAQTKLEGYLMEQIDFLDQGGTVAGFIRQKSRQAQQQAPQQAPVQQAPQQVQPVQIGRFVIEEG